MVFTINDITQRVVLVEAIALARQIRIALFNNQGGLVQEITPLLNTTSSAIVDLPARLVEIEKADLTIKSYLSLPFAVFF